MHFDAFTVSAILVAALAVVLIYFVQVRSQRETQQRIDSLERRMHTGGEATLPSPGGRELCGAIHRIYPNARVGLDFQVREDDTGPHISKWLMPLPEPAPEDLEAALQAYRTEQKNSGYREARLVEYPGVGDQLDALYKARTGDTGPLAAIDAQIAAVKARHPKPGEC